MFEVPEGHELDDVAKDGLSLGRPQNPIVAIQHLHVTEVCVAHSHDDDRHGEVGGMDDGLPRVGHVCDDPVSQDQQDEVLLPSVGHQEMMGMERWETQGQSQLHTPAAPVHTDHSK